MPFAGARRVSVVIPTRNRCALLIRALQSIQHQTYPNWNVLIVDDGSTDGTATAVEALKDPRIKLLQIHEHRGAGYSRWYGAGLSDGDFVAFLDSDDFWQPHKLWRQLAAVEHSGQQRVVVIAPALRDDGHNLTAIDHHHLQPGQSIIDYVYTGRQATILSSCLLIDGALARQVRFDPALPVNQDTDYLMRLEQAGARFIGIDEPLYVLDARPRPDRISKNPRLISESRAWFDRVSGSWSTAARRGYLLWDLSVRCSSSGQRLQGIKYFLLGLTLSAGPRRLVHQLLRIIGGGEIPSLIRRLRRPPSTRAQR